MTAQRWIYRWTYGKLERAGAVTTAYLDVWEYEAVSGESWRVSDPEGDEVRVWRTRRPDLAPAEICVGDRLIDRAPAQFVRSAPDPARGMRRTSEAH